MRLPLILPKFLITIIFILFGIIAHAPEKTITGNVTDVSTGQPVIGTTVSVKGTTSATQTNVQENFTIQVPGSAKSLTISFIGFETHDVLINGRNQISIPLKNSVSNLSEVVVVDYGTQGRKDLTGSVCSVSAATIAKVLTNT